MDDPKGDYSTLISDIATRAAVAEKGWNEIGISIK